MNSNGNTHNHDHAPIGAVVTVENADGERVRIEIPAPVVSMIDGGAPPEVAGIVWLVNEPCSILPHPPGAILAALVEVQRMCAERRSAGDRGAGNANPGLN